MTRKYELSRALDLPTREVEVIERFLAEPIETAAQMEQVQEILRRWFISRGLLTGEKATPDAATAGRADVHKTTP